MGRYIAFISYRHRNRDQRISFSLRKSLETMHLPSKTELPAKRRVFRDTDELPTSADLGTDIDQALTESDRLIALCSPEYIESKWCMREIRRFCELGRKDRIIPIIVSGDRKTAMPEEIRDIQPVADLSDLHGRRLKNETDDAAARILAGLTAGDAGEIARCEKRYRLGVGAALAAIALIVILGFALYAFRTAERIAGNNRRIAAATEQVEAARKEAEEQRNEAILKESRYYARKAWQMIDRGEDTKAATFAVKGLPEGSEDNRPYDYEALSALRMALSLPADADYDYELKSSAETGFSVNGWISHTDGLDLTEDGIGCVSDKPVHFLSFITEEIRDSEPEKRPEIMVNDELFAPDHMITDPYGKTLAWTENPTDGRGSRVVLYEDKTATELELDGVPASVSFSGSRLAVVNDSGVLTVFDAYTGKKRAVAEGRYSHVNYLSGNSALLAVTDAGEACLLDTADFSTVFRMESPTPVKSLMYCSQRGWILACCADGFRIYNEDGQLVVTVRTEEEPSFAVWGGYDDMVFLHNGNLICVLYEHKAEIYTIREKNRSLTLYQPLASGDSDQQTAAAFFSEDADMVYLQETHGELSGWDAETGELIWTNKENAWTSSEGSHTDCALSADGKAIWRVKNETDGYDKVDAKTGRIIYTNALELKHITIPRESPDGRLAIALTVGQKGMCVFRPDTGGLLWKSEESGLYQFSSDSGEVYSIGADSDTEAGITSVRFVARNADTGEETSRIPLCSCDGDAVCSRQMNREGNLAAVLYTDGRYDRERTQEYILSTFELPSGRPLNEERITAVSAGLILNYEGNISVEITDEEGNFIYRIGEDGSLGKKESGDSESGRRLRTKKEDYCLFAGEETYRDCARRYDSLTESHIWHAALYRFSDNAAVIRKEDDIWIDLAVSPGGERACLYGYYLTPLLIRAGDIDSLTAAGRQLLEEAGQ